MIDFLHAGHDHGNSAREFLLYFLELPVVRIRYKIVQLCEGHRTKALFRMLAQIVPDVFAGLCVVEENQGGAPPFAPAKEFGHIEAAQWHCNAGKDPGYEKDRARMQEPRLREEENHEDEGEDGRHKAEEPVEHHVGGLHQGSCVEAHDQGNHRREEEQGEDRGDGVRMDEVVSAQHADKVGQGHRACEAEKIREYVEHLVRAETQGRACAAQL